MYPAPLVCGQPTNVRGAALRKDSKLFIAEINHLPRSTPIITLGVILTFHRHCGKRACVRATGVENRRSLRARDHGDLSMYTLNREATISVFIKAVDLGAREILLFRLCCWSAVARNSGPGDQ